MRHATYVFGMLDIADFAIKIPIGTDTEKSSQKSYNLRYIIKI
jgi:hypothetical protein